MTYKLMLTDEFEKDLDSIVEYISVRLGNPQAAKRLISDLKKELVNISKMPKLYPLYHDKKIADLGYRYFPIKNYLVFYRLNEIGKVIYVSSICYGKREIEGILP